MKRNIVIAMSAALLLTSCGTYTGTGAYVGTNIGGILGSAIGGISDGPRGSDIGTIVGMAGGAVVGGIIGNQADQAQREAVIEHHHRVQQQQASRRSSSNDDTYSSDSSTESYEQSGAEQSGFDASNSGDDRIYDFSGSDYTGDYSAQQPTTTVPAKSSVESMTQGLSYNPSLEIRNARFVDDNQDNAVSRGELCKVIFEVYNTGRTPVYDVVPTVVETTGNRHIFISPNMHVEQIAPGKGIRYTALVKADNRLKDGSIRICVSVVQGGKAISKVAEFNIPTKKR